MKILFIKEKTIVIEGTFSDFNGVFKGMSCLQDFQNACSRNEDIELSLSVLNFKETDRQATKRMIDAMESAVKFLKNQSDDLYNKDNQ